MISLDRASSVPNLDVDDEIIRSSVYKNTFRALMKQHASDGQDVPRQTEDHLNSTRRLQKSRAIETTSASNLVVRNHLKRWVSSSSTQQNKSEALCEAVTHNSIP
jgi:hypothetical protein